MMTSNNVRISKTGNLFIYYYELYIARKLKLNRY